MPYLKKKSRASVRRNERDGTRPRSLLGPSPIGSVPAHPAGRRGPHPGEARRGPRNQPDRPSQSIRRVGCVRRGGACVCGMATTRDRGAGGGSASRVGDGDVDLGEGWDWGAIPRLLSSACLFLCSGWVRFAHVPLLPSFLARLSFPHLVNRVRSAPPGTEPTVGGRRGCAAATAERNSYFWRGRGCGCWQIEVACRV